MRRIQPLLLPQPCQSQAHRDNDRTVPNPCFTSPRTVHIRVRILNLFHRALLWYFIAYHHDAHTSSYRRSYYVHSQLTITIIRRPYILLLQVILRVGQVWSTQSKDHACLLVPTIAPRLDEARPQGTTHHPKSLCAGLKSNNHACPLDSKSVTGLYIVGPLSTSSVSTSRHVVPRTQPICSPSRRGKTYPSPQVEESPSTVTPRLAEILPTGHSISL